MSTNSALTSGISNDDRKRKVDSNNSVEQETEVVGKSANSVHVVSSTPDSTSDNFAASDMGNAIDKGPPVLKKIIRPDAKQKQATVPVTDTCATSGISNDDGKIKVDNSSVEHETEVAGLSTNDSVTPPPSDGGVTSGKIVDAVSSIPDSTSDNFAESDMGSAIDKGKRINKPVSTDEKPSNGVKHSTAPGTEADHTPERGSNSQPAPPSSGPDNISDDKKTADEDKPASDVILPGVPDVHNDVTTSGITAEVDTKSELSTSPPTTSVDGVCTTTSSTDLAESFDVRPGNHGIPDTHSDVTTSGITPEADTSSTSRLTVDGVCTTSSSTDVVESLDVGLDNVEEVFVAESGGRHSGKSSEIHRETEDTCINDGHAVKSDHVCGQEDVDLGPCLSSQNNDAAASLNDR